MKNKLYYKHIQLIIIAGLVLGIVLATIAPNVGSLWPSDTVVYTKVYSEAMAANCDINCEIEQRTKRIFDENKDKYMEQARLDALVEMKDYLLSQIDNSPYVDYAYIAEHGYSN